MSGESGQFKFEFSTPEERNEWKTQGAIFGDGPDEELEYLATSLAMAGDNPKKLILAAKESESAATSRTLVLKSKEILTARLHPHLSKRKKAFLLESEDGVLYFAAILFLAILERSEGKTRQSIKYYEEMQQFCDDEWQDFFYILIGLYLEEKMVARLDKLFVKRVGETSPWFMWGRMCQALLRRDLALAKKLLPKARKVNPHFEKFLLDPESHPDKIFEDFKPGSYEEAVVAFSDLVGVFVKHHYLASWFEAYMQEDRLKRKLADELVKFLA